MEDWKKSCTLVKFLLAKFLLVKFLFVKFPLVNSPLVNFPLVKFPLVKFLLLKFVLVKFLFVKFPLVNSPLVNFPLVKFHVSTCNAKCFFETLFRKCLFNLCPKRLFSYGLGVLPYLYSTYVSSFFVNIDKMFEFSV